MTTHDDNIGEPLPLRVKMLADGQGLSTDERLDHLIELVAQLNDRVEALEGHVTALVTMNVEKGLGH
jgi:hypothetical protein